MERHTVESSQPPVRLMEAKHRTVIVDDVVERVAATCGMAASGLYLMLERRVNKDGCWTTTIAALAASFGQSDRHIRDAAKALEDNGFITREQVAARNGATTGVRFHLPYHLRTDRAEPTPEPRAEPTPEPSRATVLESNYGVITSSNDLSGASAAGIPFGDQSTTAPDAAPVKPSPIPIHPAAAFDTSETRDRRDAVFAAYAAVFGIKRDTGEWFKRWNLGWGHLSAEVLAGLTPERMTAIATFCRDRRLAAGYDHTPNVDVVLADESGYDRWLARGQPAHDAKPKTAARSHSSTPAPMQRGAVPPDGGLAEYRKRQQQGAKPS